jgi:hypothetical protein
MPLTELRDELLAAVRARQDAPAAV